MDRRGVLDRVSAAQDGLVTRGQALRAGYRRHEIDWLVDAGRWRAVERAVYRIDGTPVHELSRRCRVRAALMSLGPCAHAVLGTAAEIHGMAGLPATGEIHLALPGQAARTRRQLPGCPGLVVHQFAHPPGSVVRVDGMAVTTPLVTLAETIRQVPRYPAVSLLDSALNRRLVTEEELLAIPPLIAGRRGAVAARGYLTEADRRAQSPLETRTRLRCVDGRVPPDALQLEVRDDDGYLLGLGDLGWRAQRVIAEADGRGPHGTPEAAYADRRRQNRIVNAGWTVLRFTWQDTLRPDYVPWTVRQALSAAAASRRSWR
ncbi:hypothetical protein [Micromonospora endolithica]|uniref:DUF559 domain-containing protein n=1 Tax=Micromonospora endolithica TaxID=230091 RepID=A0A3A9ZK55_9ACTN|nr:hypothetical protein [Micromonospora endolithica]RKN48670.1 hypothetical protein D7223_09160 [Micromonospora endolithica]